MAPLAVLGIQCTLSILIFYLIFQRYLVPNSSRLNPLPILLLLHVFRYLPLSLFMPGQVSVEFPEYLKSMVAFGDFISGLLALIAFILLQNKWRNTVQIIWVFSVVSTLDIFIVLTFAIKEAVYLLPLGSNYFTVSVYVPLLMVSQYFIFKILLKNYKDVSKI